MKVKIGKYCNWFGPYQLVDKIFFYLSCEKREKIVEKIPSKPFEWWDKKFKKRSIYVRIDDYDTYSMDHTLALIIHPLLVKFREDITGYPIVESEDVPDNVWSGTLSEDELNVKKWEWIIDEMIWSFHQIIIDDDEEEFFTYDENDKMAIDMEALQSHRNRVKKGLMFFGKYYQNLWN